MEILPTIIVWMLFFILGMIIVFLSLITSKFAKLLKRYNEYLDNNENGQISVINLFKFLLYELKYKSSKLVLKYLYHN